MKKLLPLLSLSALIFFSCQRDEAPSPVVDENKPLSAITVKIKSASQTRADETDGEGRENDINEAFVFAYVDSNGGTGVPNYRYQMNTLRANVKTTTFKFVKPRSVVYVLANASSYFNQDSLNALNRRLSAATTEDSLTRIFQAIEGKLPKSYLPGISTEIGSFIMSGSASAPGIVATPYTMNVELERDLAKVDLLVKRNSIFTVPDGGGVDSGRYRVVSVGRVVVHRAVQKVQPLASSGTSDATYALPFGFGERPNYVQDHINYAGDTTRFEPAIDNQNPSSTNVTDYTYLYPYTLENKDTARYVYNTFYVMPNKAPRKTRGTILGIQVFIQKLNAPGTPESRIIPRYYKARISSDIESAVTSKNSHYRIAATIVGEGYADITGGGGPDTEDEINDLQVEISVQKWRLVDSEQELE